MNDRDKERVRKTVCAKCGARQCNKEACSIGELVIERQETVEYFSTRAKDLENLVKDKDARIKALKGEIKGFAGIKLLFNAWRNK